MARKRQISSAIWTDEDFISLSFGARLLYLGMISHADDEGRLTGSPIELRLKVFPADVVTPIEVGAFRGELQGRGLVAVYQHNGRPVSAIRNWLKHQSLNWVTPSKIPEPPPDAFDVTTGNTNSAEMCTAPAPHVHGLKESVHTSTLSTLSTQEGVQGKPAEVATKAKATRKRRSEVVDPASVDPDVRRLWFTHLEATARKPGGLYVLTEARVKILQDCLDWCMGSVATAERGMRAVGASAFHRGQNDREKRYDALEDAPFKKRETFVGWTEKGGGPCSPVEPDSNLAWRAARKAALAALVPGAYYRVVGHTEDFQATLTGPDENRSPLLVLVRGVGSLDPVEELVRTGKQPGDLFQRIDDPVRAA